MRVISCVCGARVEAPDGEDIVPAMMAHSNAAHPEMNFTDAQVRAMMDAHDARVAPWDGTERVLDAGAITIRPLTPDRANDFLAFFDRDAFADNPAWSGCYCLFYNVEHGSDWERRTPEQKRSEKEQSIKSGESQGLMAYLDGKVVGWCHAAPMSTLRGLAEHVDSDDPEAATTGAIVCFNVAPSYRGQGLAKRLLGAACDALRNQGMTLVRVMPPREAPSAARAYHGTITMYEGAGFTFEGDAGPYVVMSKRL
jgi:GNAT superfamily N-acetyltransferase